MKRCPACKLELDDTSFFKNRDRPDGLSIRCKACFKEYDNTPRRRALRAWIAMNSRVKRQPSYSSIKVLVSKEDFLAWALPLYEAWDQEHPNEVPSVDRIDGNKHYELSNMQIISMAENRKKHRNDKTPHAPNGHAWCHACQTYLPTGNFWKLKTSSNGLQKRCIPCHKESIARSALKAFAHLQAHA